MATQDNAYQAEQAAQFVAANAAGIEQVRALLLKGADTLAWSIIGTHAGLASKIYERLALGDTGELFSTMRPMACHFVAAQQSSRFWSWIDAAGFLHDSSSDRWRYMTMEMRRQYLRWAEQGAQETTS